MYLCLLDEVPDGGSRGCDPLRSGQDSVLLVRRGARVQAWRDWCPHLGTPLAWRKNAYLNAARDRIVCAAHGAEFELEQGRCTLGPCLGQALTPLAVHVHDNGEVHLAQDLQETSP